MQGNAMAIARVGVEEHGKAGAGLFATQEEPFDSRVGSGLDRRDDRRRPERWFRWRATRFRSGRTARDARQGPRPGPVRSRWSAGVAIGVSAVAFTAEHGVPIVLPTALLTGLLAGWLRERSGSTLNTPVMDVLGDTGMLAAASPVSDLGGPSMMDTTTLTPTPKATRSGLAGRWAVLLGGVVNPVAFVAAYTVAGALRPGYSPVHQAISDLGVGSHGQVMDGIAAIHALLLIGFAVGFAVLTRPLLSPGWRRLATALLVLRGLAGVTTASFTEAPATVAVHSLATIVALLSMLSAFLVVGVALRRDARLRRWGTDSLVFAVVMVLLVAVMFWLFNPNSPAAPTRLGGLAERLVSVETLAWYVVFGWRLFRTGPPARHPRTVDA